LPLVFKNPADYGLIQLEEVVEITNLPAILNFDSFKIKINGKEIEVQQSLSPRQKELLVLGGLINWVKLDLQSNQHVG
jgi:aconitate hydratase